MHGWAITWSLRVLPGLAAVAVLMLLGTGCSRKFFRTRTDNDVAGVITQKNVFGDWQVQNWHVYPDPRARYADPSNPDRPPYPVDDYAARVLAPNPQHPRRKPGAGRYEGSGYLDYLARWDAENRAAANGPQDQKRELLPEPEVVGPGAKAELPHNPDVIPASAISIPSTGAALAWLEAPTLRATPRVGPACAPPMLLTDAWFPETLGASRVMILTGEIPDGDKTIPAALIVSANQQPLKPGPNGTEGPTAVVATGAAADDIFKALESKQTGYRITIEQAVELAILNSREFQNQREFLYEAALPVTLQRFNFAALGFFTETAGFDWAGRLLGRVPQNSFAATTTPSLSKLFPTGALLAVKLANQVVVDLSNGRPTATVSNFGLSLSQPFLQGGGYAVTLEPLTQAERTLVYAIRSYARFRKVFFLAIAAGGSYTNNPYGFPGLSQNLGRSVGNNFTAPDPGYLAVLLATEVVDNQRRNVNYLSGLLKLYQAFREGGLMSDLQVAIVESNLVNSRGSLLGTSTPSTAGGVSNVSTNGGIRTLLDGIDSFKLQLGVPLTVGIEFDKTPLSPIRGQLNRFEAIYAQVRDAETSARRYDPAEPVAQFRARWRKLFLEAALTQGTPFAATIIQRWAAWEKLTGDQLTKRMSDLAAERRKLLDQRADRQLKNQPEPESEVQKVERIEAELEIGEFERTVRAYEAQPWLKEQGRLRVIAQAAAFRDVVNAVFQVILEARNERLDIVGKQWPKLPPIVVKDTNIVEASLDEAYAVVIETALENRLDLMSARAQVVDAWRQIKVSANALQGVLDLQYNLNSSTPNGGSNPFAFSGATTENQLTLTGELPLVRRAQRNNYRTALIGYQVARRALQAFEDNIANDVRADVRSLRTLTELYKVQQRLVQLGYFQVDNAQALLLAPPPAGQGPTEAGNQAALTSQLLSAQSQLVGSQNSLFTLWVNFIIARMDFYADTDLMKLDERGIWQDEYLPGITSHGAGAQPRGERLPAPTPAPGVQR
ncbi:MAG TPA: TolC family protein [Urbifossiella sp.]|nr:TolC family protein [Urbifossiella sp.]